MNPHAPKTSARMTPSGEALLMRTVARPMSTADASRIRRYSLTRRVRPARCKSCVVLPTQSLSVELNVRDLELEELLHRHRGLFHAHDLAYGDHPPSAVRKPGQLNDQMEGS